MRPLRGEPQESSCSTCWGNLTSLSLFYSLGTQYKLESGLWTVKAGPWLNPSQ